MSTEDSVPPSVLWAQRASAILLTICVEDCKKPDIQIKADSLEFSGIGGADKKNYKLTIPLYSEIDPENSLHSVRDRNIELVLKKKEEGPFWPRLTKDKVKCHWLKVDFNKWKDEDDSEGEGEGLGNFGGGGGDELEEMMKQMGGLKSQGGKPSLDDLPDSDDEQDSDEGELPDLE